MYVCWTPGPDVTDKFRFSFMTYCSLTLSIHKNISVQCAHVDTPKKSEKEKKTYEPEINWTLQMKRSSKFEYIPHHIFGKALSDARIV